MLGIINHIPLWEIRSDQSVKGTTAICAKDAVLFHDQHSRALSRDVCCGVPEHLEEKYGKSHPQC